MCSHRPSNIRQSSTFVVDLEALKHPDDVKKDEFGSWKYSGSHVTLYSCLKNVHQKQLRFERVCPGKKGDVIKLRRIHCKHPSNPDCQRLLAFATGMNGFQCCIFCQCGVHKKHIEEHCAI